MTLIPRLKQKDYYWYLSIIYLFNQYSNYSADTLKHRIWQLFDFNLENHFFLSNPRIIIIIIV